MIPPSRPNITRLTDSSVMVRWGVPPNNGLPIQFFKVQYCEMTRAGNGKRRGGGSGARSRGPSESKGSRWMTSNEDIPPHIRSYEVDGLETDHTYRYVSMCWVDLFVCWSYKLCAKWHGFKWGNVQWKWVIHRCQTNVILIQTKFSHLSDFNSSH